MRALVQHLGLAVIAKDLSGTITVWNSGAARLFGSSSEEIVGQPITLLIPPDKMSEEAAILASILRGEGVRNLETDVDVEASQLVMLLQNLIRNAIKFRKSGVVTTVHDGAINGGKFATFSVTDNGIGIPPPHRERVFGIFQRLHTRREYSGTGIGLAVCKCVVEHNGGRIWVESATGEGTTFQFTLPLVAEGA